MSADTAINTQRLNRRMRMAEESHKTLIEAMVSAQGQIQDAARTAVNDFYTKKNTQEGHPYATLEDVIQAVKQPLLDEGIVFLQKSQLVDGGICIETVFHGHGEELSAGPMFVPADKRTPQSFGSALTYARRYSLSTACGIGAKDDDGNSANAAVVADPNHKEEPKKKPAKPKTEVPTPKKVEALEGDDLFKNMSNTLKDRLGNCKTAAELKVVLEETWQPLKTAFTGKQDDELAVLADLIREHMVRIENIGKQSEEGEF